MTQQQQSPSPIEVLRTQVNVMLDESDQGSTIATTLAFKVKRDGLAQFQKMADVLTAATRRRRGCQQFYFHPHKPIPGAPWDKPIPGIVRYAIYERWKSVADFRFQWNSPELHDFQNKVFALIDGFPDIAFYGEKPEESAAHPAPVLQTGQGKCWDEDGEVVPCKNTGQDGAVHAGVVWPKKRFTDNGDGTVTDNRSGLIWLQNADYYGAITWPDALVAVQDLCDGVGDLQDGSKKEDRVWRMPNVNEMQSLLHLSNESGPAVADEHCVFRNLHSVNYWSSSSVALAPPLGWYLAMGVGPPVFDLKINPMHAWPVKGESQHVARTGQTKCWDEHGQKIDCKDTGQDGNLQKGVAWDKSRRFHDNNDGTATDLLTGLIWLKDPEPLGTRSWQDALDACANLAAGQCHLSDGSTPGVWRLPNVHELRSLIDYDEHSPALSKGHPFHVRPSLYWSSTTVPSAPNQARFVFVGIGPSVWDHKSVMLGVWPVKGGTP